MRKERKKSKKKKITKHENKPGTGLKPSQASLLQSVKNLLLQMEESFPTWDIRGLSQEELTGVIKELMRFISMRINTKGEVSYVAKKSALFLTEMLLGALRRGISMKEVPEVHTILLDELYNSIDATHTGLYEDADISILEEESEKPDIVLLKQALNKAGKRAPLLMP